MPTVEYNASSCDLGNIREYDAAPDRFDCTNGKRLVTNDYSACAVHYGSDSCLPYRGRNDSPQTLLDRMGSWQRCWVYGPNPSKTTFTDPVMLLDEALSQAQDAAGILMMAGGPLLAVTIGYFLLRHYVQNKRLHWPCGCCNDFWAA